MKILMVWISALLLVVASGLEASCCGQKEEFTLEIGNIGYRVDRVHWSVEGPNDSPPLLSRVRWKDIQSYQVMGTFKWVSPDRIYIRGMADYGKIFHGRFQEVDFIDEDTPSTIIRGRADRGEVFDFNGGIGYHFSFLANRATIAPLVGFSHHEQHFRENHTIHLIQPLTGFNGEVSGFHGHYRSRWNGPWAGADFTFGMTHCLALYGGGEYHWNVHYKAQGKSNFVTPAMTNYQQHAEGHGELFTLGIAYKVSRHWSVNIVGNYQGWHTRDHDAEQEVPGALSFGSGSGSSGSSGSSSSSSGSDNSNELELRPVHWHSWSVMFSILAKY